MIEIEKPNISTVPSEDEKNVKFVVEPLERGYGVTLGNSLRRVLLSSLPGVAVTNIRIDGVLHEISTITGVKEDVCEIVLNVKGITAKLYGDSIPKTVVIDVTGACEVTARAISSATRILRFSIRTTISQRSATMCASTWSSPSTADADMFLRSAISSSIHFRTAVLQRRSGLFSRIRSTLRS